MQILLCRYIFFGLGLELFNSLPWSIWKKRSNSFYISKSTEAKQLARQGIEQILSPKQTRRPLPCLLILSFFYDCSLPLPPKISRYSYNEGCHVYIFLKYSSPRIKSNLRQPRKSTKVNPLSSKKFFVSDFLQTLYKNTVRHCYKVKGTFIFLFF